MSFIEASVQRILNHVDKYQWGNTLYEVDGSNVIKTNLDTGRAETIFDAHINPIRNSERQGLLATI